MEQLNKSTDQFKEGNNDFTKLPPFANSNLEVTQRLLKFLDETGFNLIQSNGQRRYGPPPNWSGPAPPRGCEIFIGKLPRDCFEDELVPAFEKIGPIYEMRLMMDFNGLNRGYGFIKYCKIESAHRAVMLMDDYEIRPGKKIGVSKSVDNCRLFVGNINLYKTAEEVKEELSEYVEGIVRVIMYPSLTDKSKNRGFVFVEFENHRYAAMARRILKSGGVFLWEQQIIVDWAEPEPEVDPKIMTKIRKLYIRNLDVDTTEETLRTILESLTCPSNILRIKKLKDYAFIHFKTRGSAELVLMKLQDFVLNGQKLEVTWARPPMYSKTRIALPDKMSLCLSLPPRLRTMHKMQRISSPAVTPVIPAFSTYCCVRPPQMMYSVSPSAGSSMSSTSTNGSSTQQSIDHQPIPNISFSNNSNNMFAHAQTNVQQTQFCLPDQMQNLFISTPTSTVEHPFLPMPFGPTMRLPPPPQPAVPFFYPFYDRAQAMH